jgi:hypothetical protein
LGSFDGWERPGGASFSRMVEPDEQQPRVRKPVSRPLMLLVAMLILVVFTLIGWVGQDLSLAKAVRAALVPFAVAVTLAFLIPWMNEHINSGK